MSKMLSLHAMLHGSMFMLNKIVVIFFMLVGIAFADTELASPPVIPDALADGESIEPEVNIIQGQDRIIEEYRVDGQLYMIKVTPKGGVPYYFIDTDGDSHLETSRYELAPPEIPQWILFRW